MLDGADKTHLDTASHTGVRPVRPGLGLGGAPLGNLHRAISDAEATAVVEAAWGDGIRHFDTAPLYGRGLSERRIGAVLADKPRDAFILSTKVGRLLDPDAVAAADSAPYVDVLPFAIRRDYSRDGVLRSLDDSRRRLGIDRIDIVYVHDLEPGSFANPAAYEAHCAALLDSGWRALADLRDAGDIGAIGAGVNQVAACERLMRDADPDLFLLAGRYTLLDRTADALIDRCAARGIGVVAAGVFNSGILARGPDATFDYAAAPAAVRDRVTRMMAVCAAAGPSLAAVALAFVLRDRRLAGVLVGAQSVAEIEQNAALAGARVPDEVIAAVLAC